MADVANILAVSPVPSGAYCAVAPLGTTLPTSATAALPTGYLDLGWVTDDGVTVGMRRDTTKHYAWGGDVVKVTMNKYTETIKVSLYETNLAVQRAVFGDSNVVATIASGHQIVTVEHSPLMLTHQVFCFTYVDGVRTGRTIIRNGQITDIGDITLVHTKPIVYSLTVDIFKTSGGLNGVFQMWDNVDVTAGT